MFEWLWWWSLVLLGVFLIGLTKSGFGSGVGLFNVPLIVLAMGHTAMGSEAALGLMLPLLILGDLVALWQYRDLFLPAAPPQAPPPPASSVDGEAIDEILPPSDAAEAGSATAVVAAQAVALAETPPETAWTGKRLIRYLLPGTAVGVVLGGLLLWWFHQHADLVGALIRLEIGFECLLLLSMHYYRQWRGLQTRLLPEPARGTLTGAFAGVSSTLAHAAGPIIAMYLLPLRPPRRLFVGTCALYFAMLNSAKLPAYFMSGMFASISPRLLLMLAPLVFAGAAAGFWVNRRMSDRLFTQIIYAGTLVLGLYLLWDGAAALLAAVG
jgi:uncharacterized membrane protein YfcA